MKRFLLVAVLFVLASLLAACATPSLTEAQVSEIAAQAAKDAVAGIEFPEQKIQPIAVEVVMPVPQAEEPEPVDEPEVVTIVAPVVSNSLVNPVLFDADTQPVGDDEGFFDLGVNPGQIGIVFGWDLSWGANSILSSGWYEDFRMVDGRYEVYSLPSSDPTGWTQVLVDQRVAEQAEHYGCPADKVPPTWDGE